MFEDLILNRQILDTFGSICQTYIIVVSLLNLRVFASRSNKTYIAVWFFDSLYHTSLIPCRAFISFDGFFMR